MKDLVNEIANTENKITEFNGISEKLYDTKIQMSKVESSIKELKRFTDTLHNEILLLEGKDDDDKDIVRQLVDLKDELEDTKIQLNKITEEKKYLDVAREILSDRGAKHSSSLNLRKTEDRIEMEDVD